MQENTQSPAPSPQAERAKSKSTDGTNAPFSIYKSVTPPSDTLRAQTSRKTKDKGCIVENPIDISFVSVSTNDQHLDKSVVTDHIDFQNNENDLYYAHLSVLSPI